MMSERTWNKVAIISGIWLAIAWLGGLGFIISSIVAAIIAGSVLDSPWCHTAMMYSALCMALALPPFAVFGYTLVR